MGTLLSEFCLYFSLRAYSTSAQFNFQDLKIFQAEPLVVNLAAHELIDERIKDTYDAYGLYQLARAAYLCVRANPEQRPSMGEVSFSDIILKSRLILA
jgi:hypothetical protein